MSLSHQAIAFLVTFIWGTNFVLIKYALDEIEAFPLAMLRFLFAAVPLVFFLPKPDVQWRYMIGYGFFIGVVQFGVLFWAMQSDITPGLASLVVQLQVFITVGLAVVLLKEQISVRQLAAMLIGFAGLSVLFFNTGGDTTVFGLLLALIAALGWASGNLIVKYAGEVDVFAFVVWSSLFAVPPLFVMSLFYQDLGSILQDVVQLSVFGWGSVLWQSIGNMLLGFALWNLLLNRYPAALVAPWALLIPVFGMATSWLVLSEPMPCWKLLAMALIVVALMFNTLGSKPA